jgi:hypothetical protein
MIEQQTKPLVPAERVQRFAPGETLVCLAPPPFRTIAAERAAGGSGDFWQRFGALHQIEPEKAIVIGDFGLGSDSPIILDYSRNAADPRVLRLRWSGNGPETNTEWVEGARNFDHFAELLGLSGGIALREPRKNVRATIFVAIIGPDGDEDYRSVQLWFARWGDRVRIEKDCSSDPDFLCDVEGPPEAIAEIPERMLCSSRWSNEPAG